MRRVALALALIAAAATVVFSTAAGGEEGTYEVRGIFDSGGFLVEGEDVRIAGARAGAISEVDVTRPGEPVHADGSDDPGKAVVVMRIDDPAFQDFREDAFCIVRPQGFLGERFVECRPTSPRAPGSEPPPELKAIPEGEPGAGQRLLPVESNGKAVDLDLVNNIMREPYADRFRLIINDLGAGLAARGDDLDAIIERANPALRRTDEVLAILARQNRQLAGLARDGDRVLAPLAREREHISGFLRNTNATAQATAERRADLEAQLVRLPGFLRELELTMTELDRFSTAATPVVSDLGDAAPDLTRSTVALEPFSDAGTRALRSLGNAADEVGPRLVNADPILVDLRDLAKETRPLAQSLASLLADLRQTGAYHFLTRTIYNLSAAINGFDSYGHLLRGTVPLNNCFFPKAQVESGCNSDFTQGGTVSAPAKRERAKAEERPVNPLEGIEDVLEGTTGVPPAEEPPAEPPAEEPPAEEPETQGAGPSAADAEVFLDYLFGEPQRPGKSRHRRDARRHR